MRASSHTSTRRIRFIVLAGIMLSALTGAPSLAASQRNFTLQTDAGFPVQATVTGTVRTGDKVMSFKVDAIEVKRLEGVNLPLMISTVAIGIAYRYNARQWTIHEMSPAQLVAAKVPEDGTVTIAPLEFRIALDRPIPEGAWIVFSFAVPVPGTDKFAYSYAHEPHGR